MRRVIAILGALLFAVLGPRLTGPNSHAAGTPFVYEPPAGFAEAADQSTQLRGKSGADAHVYVEGTKPGAAYITVIHTSKSTPVEEQELARLVPDMPQAFDGCRWTHRRHEMRLRPDGARVGLIEGDCEEKVALDALGLPSKTIMHRKLQLIFPDDTGTSIVTSSSVAEDAARLEPILEGTIATAKGVATRVPAASYLVYLAWAAGGAVLGWFGGGLVQGSGAPTPSKEAPREKLTSLPKRRDDEESDAGPEGEDEDDDGDDDEDTDNEESEDTIAASPSSKRKLGKAKK